MESPKSFYDLDYLVELGEKRVDQYTSAYQTILGRLTNIILVYSILGLYLIPIVQDFVEINSYIFKIGLVVMIGLTFISVIFTIRLMWPVYVSYLEISEHYYQDLRIDYESRAGQPNLPNESADEKKARINQLLKASYLVELNKAQVNNRNVFVRKSAHYYRALLFGLMATAPYVLCIGYHINKKEDKVQKVELVNEKSFVNCSRNK